MANLDDDSEEEDLIDEQISQLKQKRKSVLSKCKEDLEPDNKSGGDSATGSRNIQGCDEVKSSDSKSTDTTCFWINQ